MGRKTKAQMESTRAAILASALETLAADPNASMATIASNAGIGRATLHRHMASRKELIVILALDAIAQTDRACDAIDYLQQPAIDALAQTLHAIAPLGSRYAFLVTQPEAYAVPEVERELQRQHGAMLSLIKACQQQKSLRSDIPATWINAALDALIYATWTEIAAGRLDQAKAGSQVFDTLTRGCAEPESSS